MDLDELVFHPWAVQVPRTVPTFVAGSGSYLIDPDGRPYLDFGSQLMFTNLGHQHPGIVAAVQADRGHRSGHPGRGTDCGRCLSGLRLENR
jgi:taurine---2-oxoglutarate transaminase